MYRFMLVLCVFVDQRLCQDSFYANILTRAQQIIILFLVLQNFSICDLGTTDQEGPSRVDWGSKNTGFHFGSLTVLVTNVIVVVMQSCRQLSSMTIDLWLSVSLDTAIYQSLSLGSLFVLCTYIDMLHGKLVWLPDEFALPPISSKNSSNSWMKLFETIQIFNCSKANDLVWQLQRNYWTCVIGRPNYRNSLARRDLLRLQNLRSKILTEIHVFQNLILFPNLTVHCSKQPCIKKEQERERATNLYQVSWKKFMSRETWGTRNPGRFSSGRLIMFNRAHWRWKYNPSRSFKLCGVERDPILHLKGSVPML